MFYMLIVCFWVIKHMLIDHHNNQIKKTVVNVSLGLMRLILAHLNSHQLEN